MGDKNEHIKKSGVIRKNYLYSLILTVFNSIFPLLTAPYLSRALGASTIGEASYVLSTVTWFTGMATFGINNYGVREIAKKKNDIAGRKIVFSELIILNSITVLIAFIIYIICIFNIATMREHVILFIINGVSLITSIFTIDWLYQGLEKYKYITSRNIVIKILSLVLIYLLVKEPSDISEYILIITLGSVASNIYNIIYCIKYVGFTIINIHPFTHYKKCLIYAFANFINSIYSSFDKVLLGMLAVSSSSLAFYTRSMYVVNMGLSVIYAFTKVNVASATYAYHTEDTDKYLGIVTRCYNYIMLLAFPICAGIYTLSYSIMFILGDVEFANSHLVLRILAIAVLTNSLNHWIYNLVIIPIGKEKVNLKMQIISACLSLLINLTLIPKIDIFGAVISYLIAQSMVLIIGIYLLKNRLTFFRFITKHLYQCLVSTLIMSIILNQTMKLLDKGDLVHIVLLVILGIVSYFTSLLIMKNVIVIKIMVKSIKNIREKYKKY